MCFCSAHSVCCELLNIMPRPDPVEAICQPSDSVSGDDDRLEFIWCVGGRQPKINEICTFSDDGITPEVHPTARVDIGAFFGDFFFNNYLTENGRRGPMFGRNLINGSFEWMCVPEFLSTNGPPLDCQYPGSLCGLGAWRYQYQTVLN